MGERQQIAQPGNLWPGELFRLKGNDEVTYLVVSAGSVVARRDVQVKVTERSSHGHYITNPKKLKGDTILIPPGADAIQIIQ